jgi:hypothetical protein
VWLTGCSTYLIRDIVLQVEAKEPLTRRYAKTAEADNNGRAQRQLLESEFRAQCNLTEAGLKQGGVLGSALTCIAIPANGYQTSNYFESFLVAAAICTFDGSPRLFRTSL